MRFLNIPEYIETYTIWWAQRHPPQSLITVSAGSLSRSIHFLSGGGLMSSKQIKTVKHFMGVQHNFVYRGTKEFSKVWDRPALITAVSYNVLGTDHCKSIRKGSKNHWFCEKAHNKGGGGLPAQADTSLGFFCMLQTYLFGLWKPQNKFCVHS